MGIINFGSMNVDHVYSMQHFVQPGETLQSGAYNIYCGGKGLNQSVAAARAGAKTIHAGMCGKGGEMLLDFLGSNGVDLSFIGKPDVPQGHAIIQVSESGENSIILFPGSNDAVTKEYVDSVLDQQQGAPYVILQNEISEVPYIIEAAYKKGFPVVFNASPFDASLLKIDFSKITWLLVNEIEGGCVTGETEPEAILKKMREKYPETGVVLTLGKEGSICAKGDTVIHQGIFPVNTVDTTAAGDTFTGYFIAGLDAGLTLEEALCRASAASAVAVTRPGAAPSIPLAEEVTAFLKERQ